MMNIINDVLVDKLFKDPPKMTKEIPLLSEKTVSGDGMIVINDAYSDFPIKNLTLQGNTKQDSTTGAQLFDADRMNGLTKSGVTISVKDGMITATGTATGTATKDEWIQAYVSIEGYKKLFKPGERIFIKRYKTTDCNYDFELYGGHGNPILGTVTEQNSQPSGVLLPDEYPRTETTFYFFLDVKKGVTLKGSLQPMVYQTGNGTYEPYTGGKPSPSPDYPQEIKNVGKWNEETQKYEVDVKITGKNLFDADFLRKTKEEWKRESYYYTEILVGKGNKISFSIEKDLQAGLNYFVNIGRLKGNGNFAYKWIYSSTQPDLINKKGSLVAEDDVVYVNWSINPTDSNINSLFENIFDDLQIEISDASTEYEPYKEQTLTLTSDRPITKWDKLVEQDGQIGWLYKAVFDSDVRPSRYDLFPSGFSIYKDHPNGVFTYKASFAKKEIGWQTSVCKQFKNVDGSYDSGTLWNYSDQTAVDSVYFNSNIATLESFVKWMEENPLEMVYKSRESEFIPLQQSEQDAIRALTTYYPTTVVTVDGGELPVGIEVTYMKPEYIPTKQSALRMWFKENPII